MNAVRALTGWPGVRSDLPLLGGLPHLAATAASFLVFGLEPAIAGLMLAIVASAIVFRPLTPLAMNRWQPMPLHRHDPELSPRARLVLVGLWTTTAWSGAALVWLAH